MRTTLTLEKDVAVGLARLQRERDVSFKQVVNEALRHGLRQMTSSPPRRRKFRTRTVSLGECRIGSIDDVAGALALVEGERLP